MQLILNTEASLDINTKMSTLDQESADIKTSVSDIILELKNNILNSNKENVQTQEDIINNGNENTDEISQNNKSEASEEEDIVKDHVNDAKEDGESVEIKEEIGDNENCKIDEETLPNMDNNDVGKADIAPEIISEDSEIDVQSNENCTESNVPENITNENDIDVQSNENFTKIHENNEDTTKETRSEIDTTCKEEIKEEIAEEEAEEEIIDEEIKEEKNTDLKSDVEEEQENSVKQDSEVCIVEEESTELETTSAKVEDSNNVILCKNISENTTNENKNCTEVMDLEEVNEENQQTKEEIIKPNEEISTPQKPEVQDKIEERPRKSICRLSNTLDILSDDDDDPPKQEIYTKDTNSVVKQCINIEDDDDIMLIDEDINGSTDKKDIKETTNLESNNSKVDAQVVSEEQKINVDVNTDNVTAQNSSRETLSNDGTSSIISEKQIPDSNKEQQLNENTNDKEHSKKTESIKPLLPENFLKSCKKNIADMTRDDLEEFCILKIVESIVDRGNLSDIKTKLKTMAQNIEEYKKKAMMLTKQNRDLQVVLKSVQEEQKKKTDAPIAPLKITRSVGMQVLMTEKPGARKNAFARPQNTMNNNASHNKIARNSVSQNPRTPPKPSNNNAQQIPVPRLVPASNSLVNKTSTVSQVNTMNSQGKISSPVQNGVKNSPQTSKTAEKRPHSKVQSVTVDLTDDEPPSKVAAKNAPAVQAVRLVPPQNLLAPQRQFGQTINSPRKVYIPISGAQGPQNIRPGQTIMLRSVPQGPRVRCPTPQMVRVPQNALRMPKLQCNRHPAPLPDTMKQYQPPNWKALPPAPDLKLSKVENGIVISWKIEGYQEDSYEEIASYQLYAYQETSSPPSTALWKKIGDVKALPLPMACTLTQFMAGYKYYFAVRAVDIRSRFGPFSLPGSILLLNKV